LQQGRKYIDFWFTSEKPAIRVLKEKIFY